MPFGNLTRPRRLLVILAMCLVFCLSTLAQAGLGPENVCLVVNARSWASLTIANHYAEWRQIPPRNIVHVDWPAQIDMTSLDEFRLRLLAPVLKEIQARGLEQQIDAIVYSSDFPYSVRFGAGRAPADRLAVGSITALTSFAPGALAAQTPNFADLANPYAAQALSAKDQPGEGFRSRIARPIGTPGQPIYLSTMLAYTSGRGNSVREALAYLKRSVAADGISPQGTIYFCRNFDIRSTTREPGFADAVARLKQLGIGAEIVAGELPRGKADVQGAMLGAADFSWKQSGATIRPGAICEHLTSYGGILHPRKGQTPLSELLRYGAAGASGTVVEPFALAAKFPDPMIHVYYAQGSTLAEAYYQSVLRPYQLLVVGEPLCAPWARVPRITVEGLTANESISGTREVSVAITSAPPGYQVGACEWFVDGRRVASAKPDEAYRLDATVLAPGAHELRAVLISATAQATQARAIVPFDVPAAEGSAVLIWNCPERAQFGDSIEFELEFPGARGVELLHEATPIGQARGAKGRITVDSRTLGMGPARFFVNVRGTGGKSLFTAGPKTVEVAPPAMLVNRQPPVTEKLARGLQLEWGGKSSVAMSALESDWLTKAGVPAATPYKVTAWFDVDQDDVYQFQLRFNGKLTLKVDGREAFSRDTAKFKEQFYAPLSLKAGLHLLEISGQSDAQPPRLDIRFGDTPVDFPDGERFRHVH